MLFFSRKTDDTAIYKTIDLSQIQKCNLVRTENTNKAISKLELQLESFDKNKPNVSLEFYNKDQSMSLVNEIELSVKWHKIINQTL
jgi:predicted phage-related endonuclease